MKELYFKYYDYLPEPYRTQAKECYEPAFAHEERLKKGIKAGWKLEKLVQIAVHQGFDWSDTPQRHIYWYTLCTSLLNGNVQLNPLFYTKYLKKNENS